MQYVLESQPDLFCGLLVAILLYPTGVVGQQDVESVVRVGQSVSSAVARDGFRRVLHNGRVISGIGECFECVVDFGDVLAQERLVMDLEQCDCFGVGRVLEAIDEEGVLFFVHGGEAVGVHGVCVIVDVHVDARVFFWGLCVVGGVRGGGGEGG